MTSALSKVKTNILPPYKPPPVPPTDIFATQMPIISNLNSNFNSITSSLVPPPPIPPTTSIELEEIALSSQNFNLKNKSISVNRFSLPPPPLPPVLVSFDSPYPAESIFNLK